MEKTGLSLDDMDVNQNPLFSAFDYLDSIPTYSFDGSTQPAGFAVTNDGNAISETTVIAIDPDTGGALDPATDKNSLFVTGFRVLFVGIILGGAAALVNLVGEGSVVGVAQDITGASAAPQ